MHALSIIGVPTDVGAGCLGANMGPDALRVAGIAQAAAGMGFTVRDCGNLHGPANPRHDPQAGLRHLDEVLQWCRLVHDAVDAELAAGHMPLMLGGDHSLAIGSISAVARHCRKQGKKLLVIWLDAHTDFNTAALTPSGNLHGMPVSCLCGYGDAALCSVGGYTPALQPQQVLQIGIRSVDAGEKQLVREAGIDIFDMRRIDELGMPAVMHRVFAAVDGDTHVHVSFDVDFLDPDIAPGVSTPVRGGPTYREAQLCMEMIADTGRLGSIDIVELNPALDVRNQSASLMVDLLESLLGKSTLARN